MKSIRAFIAIEIRSGIRARLAELQQKLAASGADVRWVNPENIHLTLAFLGNVPAEKFQPLETALREKFQGLEPFSLSVQGTGVFGRRSRPSVVWAGIHENPVLMELQQRVVSALADTEIPFDHKPFRPHLTLGRFKSLNQLDGLFQALEKEQETIFGTMDVRAIQTIKSELKPGGAEYTTLHQIEIAEI